MANEMLYRIAVAPSFALSRAEVADLHFSPPEHLATSSEALDHKPQPRTALDCKYPSSNVTLHGQTWFNATNASHMA